MDRTIIADVAASRSRDFGFEYSLAQAPPSPLAKLSGNTSPNSTRIKWLKGRNKCNQFVGDVLTQAKFEMPTFTMPDGSLHYMNAERLPSETDFFERRTSLDQVKAGDLMVTDSLSRRGENGAHVEIVTEVAASRSLLKLIGAGSKGASLRDSSRVFKGLKRIQDGFLHPFKAAKVYFLAPTKTLVTSP